MSVLDLRRDGDVAVLSLDPAGAAVNTLDRSLLGSLSELLDRIEADGDVVAVVLASAKAHHFAAGADVREFLGFETEASVMAVLADGHALLDRLAGFPKPVVAAVDGACLGGGLELVLACSAVVATDHPSTAFALPEVQLGLLPGLGGTQRLPRAIGLRAALDLMLSGRKVYAKEARALGLTQVLVPSEAVLASAMRLARALATGDPPPSTARKGWLEGALRREPLRRLLWRLTERRVAALGKGRYPALPRILDVVRTGVERGAAAGAAAESEAFAALLFTPEARALIHLFFARSEARKNAWAADAHAVDAIAVMGAGLMGSGIAQISAKAGFEVRLKDRDVHLAARGKGEAYRGLSRRVGRGVSAFERDAMAQRIVPVASYEAISNVDLTIEAVSEDLTVKRTVREAVEAVTGPAHVYASNTSAIPIALLAEGASRPEAVVGMHYFSPVPRMPLLEVVVTASTAPWARATAVATGLRQGKAVIVVNDGPGFYTTRVLARYTAEALLLLQEGADVTLIDEAMTGFGFPLGPFALLDDVGLDVAAEIQAVLEPLLGARDLPTPEVLGRLRSAGYAGRKSGKGFYRYRRGKRLRELDRRLYVSAGLGTRGRVPKAQIEARLSLGFLDEAVRCLDDGVLRSPVDGDVGAVFGLGFPPFLGGPFRWADRRGASEVVEALDALAQQFGPRFAPAEGLQRRAEDGGRFYE